ncbi:glycosyltransferase family 4 protein [Halobacillus salinarum]|uniref:Glycosyltransferase family 4 protein n=1 Tax=Halobacillus salinarum TaxID=2932257 RepID=A0ABY4EN92_9BACI|nr:glycosyltransferase family 4 protein [Halobacillus salinarum]UOQ45417.1 glycosyltransferase family 4 protein [Halobacillus salinarum]
MNVLVLTDKLIFGGAEMYFCKLENFLRHQQISFYYAAGSGDLSRNIKRKENFFELSRTSHYSNLKVIGNLVREKGIDIIHANSLRMVLYCILLKIMNKTDFKIIYTKHNITILELKNRKLFTALLNKFVHRVITVSEFERTSLVTAGVNPNKIKTIYNGVDMDQFTYQPKEIDKEFKVGMLARLSEEKNHKFFIEVANELKQMPNLTFFIGGEGPEEEKIREKIHDHGLADKVVLLGKIHHPEKFTADMDLLLLTSHREVFPMVIIEAMAVGTPVLSIDRGGIHEAVKAGSTGFLLPEHSVKGFAEKVLLLEANREKGMELAENARKRALKEFSLERMIHSTLQEYLSCDKSFIQTG